MNEKYANTIQKLPMHYFDNLDAKFVDLGLESKVDSFSTITVEKEFTIIHGKERVTVTLEKHLRFMSSKVFTTIENTIMFKPDILFELNTLIESVEREKIYDESKSELFIEVNLKNVYSVDMILDGTDATSQTSMAKLSETFAASHPKTKCRLQILYMFESAYSEDMPPFIHLHSLRMIKCDPCVLEIISEENYRTLNSLDVFDCGFQFDQFETKFASFFAIDTLNIKLAQSNSCIISFHEGLVPFLAKKVFPNLKYLDVFIAVRVGVSAVADYLTNLKMKKEHIPGLFENLEGYLRDSPYLRYVKYNDQLDSGDTIRRSRYVDTQCHPKSRFIEIIS